MRMQPNILLAAAFVLVLAASPSFAGINQDGTYQGVHAAPGPIAGAGVGYLALAGGIYLYRRWRKQNTGE